MGIVCMDIHICRYVGFNYLGWPIMLTLCSMLSHFCYARNYIDICNQHRPNINYFMYIHTYAYLLQYILLLLAIGQVEEISLMCKPDGVINICTMVWMVSIWCINAVIYYVLATNAAKLDLDGSIFPHITPYFLPFSPYNTRNTELCWGIRIHLSSFFNLVLLCNR